VIDFPAAPTIGQEFDAVGFTYVWNGQGWTVKPLTPDSTVDAYNKVESDGRFVNVTGDTMTGNLVISKIGAAPSMIAGANGASVRWRAVLGGSDPEGGGNTGSNFSIQRYDDAGVFVDEPLRINRATGESKFRGRVWISSGKESSLVLDYDGSAAGYNDNLAFTRNGLTRWSFAVGGNAETGSNAGSDFFLYRYDDAGAGLGSPFQIARSTGLIAMGAATFSGVVNINNALTAQSLNVTSGGANIAGGFNVTSGGSAMAAGLTVGGSLISNGVLYAQSGMNVNNGNLFTGQATNIQMTLGTLFYLYYLSTSNGASLHADSGGNVHLICGTNGGTNHTYWDSGSSLFHGYDGAYKPGSNTWYITSDARIKTVLGEYTAGLEQIKTLNPIRYKLKGNDTFDVPNDPAWRGEGEPPPQTVPYSNSLGRVVAVEGKEFVGLVAQDIEASMPELVSKRAGYIDGNAVNDLRVFGMDPLVYALINAVKELAARVESLEAVKRT
jgi:hypothetical protein